MAIKRKDFQKAVSFIQDFLLKLSEDQECAELRDSLNLVLLQMQKYYRTIRLRIQNRANNAKNVRASMPHGLRPMTPYQETQDRFTWKWLHLENPKTAPTMVTLPLDANDSQSLPLMLQAVKQGDMELIKQLVAKDADSVNTDDSLGRTGLSYAVHSKQLDCLKYLLAHKADPNRLANDGSTAVHRSVCDNYIPALEVLIQYNADVTIQDSQGRSPVHWATTVNDTQCLETLLKCNVNVNVRDVDGLTPSMWACRMDHKDHFELINSASNQVIEEADGIERDFMGRTWVHWAVRRVEPLECLKSLLTPETAAIRDDEGKTVIHAAAEIGSLDSTKLILGVAGHDCINDKDDENKTCLHLATIGGHGELVNFLMEQGADQSVKDVHNALPIDYAQARRLHYCTMVFAAYQRQYERKLRRDASVDSDRMEQEHSSTIASYSGGSPSPPPGPPRPPSISKRRSSGGALQSQAKRGPSAPRAEFSNGENHIPNNHSRVGYEADGEEEAAGVGNARDMMAMGNTREMINRYEEHMEAEDISEEHHDESFDGHRTATGEIVQSLDVMEITEEMRPSQENPDVNVYDERGQVIEMQVEENGEMVVRENSFDSNNSDKSLSVGMSVSDLEGDVQDEEAHQRQHKPIQLQSQAPNSPPLQQKMTPRPPGPTPPMFAPRPPAPGPGSSGLGPMKGPTPPPAPPPQPQYSQNAPQQNSQFQQEQQYYNYNDNHQSQDDNVSGGGQHIAERSSHSIGSPGQHHGERSTVHNAGGGGGQHMPPHGHSEMQQPMQQHMPRQLAPIQPSSGKKKKKRRKHQHSNSNDGQPLMTARGAPTAPLEPVQGYGIMPNGPVSPHTQQQQQQQTQQFQSSQDNQPRVTSKGTAWEVAWEPVRPQNPVPPTTPRDDEREEFQFPQQQQQVPSHQPQPMPRGKKGNKLQGMEHESVQMESAKVNGYMEEEGVSEPVEQRRTIGRAVIEGPKQQEMPAIRRDGKAMTSQRQKTHTYPPHPQRYRGSAHHPVPAPRPPRNSTH
ncbi:uncharacterized protein [Ptychodera flava]|uniref:uncharacterized protein isoform X2 n=1 Tax=Ptychodera flava TaxID=63121 RepID=UPI00396A5E2F